MKVLQPDVVSPSICLSKGKVHQYYRLEIIRLLTERRNINHVIERKELQRSKDKRFRSRKSEISFVGNIEIKRHLVYSVEMDCEDMRSESTGEESEVA